jgi:1-aminocyclopropane-1-carboxylate synthase
MCCKSFKLPRDKKALTMCRYGMSKDFGTNGFRLGALVSQANTPLLSAVKSVACFSWTSSISELFFTTLLNDHEFLDFYLEKNSKRLGEHYKLVTDFLKENKIEYVRGGNAGFFIWVDFRSILGDDIFVLDDERGERERSGQVCHSGEKARARDQWFNEKLMEAGVYLGTGDAFFSEQHGWYRITFSVPRKVLDLGLGRLQKVIDEARAAVASTSATVSIRTSRQAAD